MKLLIVTGIFPPDVGGPAGFVARFASWLQQQASHSPCVISWSDDTSGSEPFPFPVTRIRRSERTRRLLRTLCALTEAGRDAEVWFVNGLPLSAFLVSSVLRKPTVYKVVGDAAWELAVRRKWFAGTIDEYQVAAKNYHLRLLDRLRSVPLRRASQVIVPSAYLARMAIGWGVAPSKIHVVPNSTRALIPDPDFNLPPFAGHTLLTVCRLVPWKGVAGLIDVLARLPATRLVVAGDGPSLPQLRQHARSLGVEDRVLFLGNVPPSVVARLFEEADLFVLNSSYEGLPHVVLEAMEHGVPVVATDVGGTGEVVTTDVTGTLVAPGDAKALDAALRAVLEEPEQAAKRAALARAKVRSAFSERACFEQTLALLEQAANTRARL